MTILILLSLAWAAPEPQVLPESSQLQLEGADALVESAYGALSAADWVLAAREFGSLVEGGAGEQARVLQGYALYQAGLLRDAQRVLEGVSGLQATHLRGLVMVDRGQQSGGLALLRQVEAEAEGGLKASARLNVGRVLLDQGQNGAAKASFQEAQAMAEELGLPNLAEDARRALDAVSAQNQDNKGSAAAGTTSSLNALAAALRRGAMGAAAQHLEQLGAQADTPRERVELNLAKGAFYRAEGRPDAAAEALMLALTEGRSAGLSWETAQALYGLGIAHSLAGRLDLAVSFLAEAEAEAKAGGFGASAVEIGLELGLTALRLGRVEVAQGYLDRSEQALAGMDHPAANARAAELQGALRAQAKDPAGATQAYSQALDWYQAKGSYADAARVCVGLVRVNAGQDMSVAKSWGERAVALHGQFSDPLGPAHVALAMGLGLAEAKKMDEALVEFATAVDLGRASGRRQGDFIADTAQRNAAQALAMLGASPEAAAMAASQGLEGAKTHHAALSTALQEYEQGLQAYREGRYVDAQRRFKSSGARLENMGEAAYATQADKAFLWATYNVAVSLPPSESLVFWAEILADAQRLDEQELEVRARAEQAVSLAQMGQPKADAALKKAAEQAEKSGYPRVAARCYSELAELPGPLPERAAWAQKAFALQPKAKGSVYAMYVVAVDAYNADELTLARRLAEQALPDSGELQEPLQGVLDATQ